MPSLGCSAGSSPAVSRRTPTPGVLHLPSAAECVPPAGPGPPLVRGAEIPALCTHPAPPAIFTPQGCTEAETRAEVDREGFSPCASQLRASVPPEGSRAAAAESATRSGNLLLPQKPRSTRCLRCCASARTRLSVGFQGGWGSGGRRALLCGFCDLQRFARTLSVPGPLDAIVPAPSADQRRRAPIPVCRVSRAGRKFVSPVTSPFFTSLILSASVRREIRGPRRVG